MKTLRIIIWGIGSKERHMESFLLDSVNVVAFVSNNKSDWNNKKILGVNLIPVIEPEDIEKFEFDYLIIASNAYKEIKQQCTDSLCIDSKQILAFEQVNKWEIEVVKNVFNTNVLADTNNFTIENIPIFLTQEHALPKYQLDNPMYDKFLKYLSYMVNDKKEIYVIDIGANVGDSLYAMYKNLHNKKFLCIEPTDSFYNLLKKNGRRLKSKNIIYEKSFITDNDKMSYQSNVTAGTAKKEVIEKCEKEEAPSKTLLRVLDEKNIKVSDIAMIKIDTDGYDADCIMSMKSELGNCKAILFWENYISTYEQYEKYTEAYEVLEDAGYLDYFFFDNFGNYICRGDIEVLKNINNYMQRINAYLSCKTFDYFDVLACKEGDKMLCNEAIRMFTDKFNLQVYGK